MSDLYVLFVVRSEEPVQLSDAGGPAPRLCHRLAGQEAEVRPDVNPLKPTLTALESTRSTVSLYASGWVE